MLKSSSLEIMKIVIKILVLLLCFSRFLYLDQDVPSYMISGISQEDESYYSIGALLRYYNDVDRTETNYSSYSGDPVCMYSTPLTYLSFHALGNNYWGLRFVIPLLSLMIILFLFRISYKEIDSNTQKYFLLLLLLTDFYFFNFSRFQTPQIYSILAISSALFCYYSIKDDSKKIFIVSFLAISSVLFVYVYNIFFVFGVILYFLIYIIQNKSIKLFYIMILGVISSFVLFLITLYFMGFSLIDYLEFFINFNDKRSAVSVDIHNGFLFFITSAIKNSFSIFYTNLFRFNSIWLFFLVCGCLFKIKVLYQKGFKSTSSDLLYFVMIFAFSQAVFLNSYPFKKWVVLLPIVYCLGIEFFKSMSQMSSRNLMISSLLTFPIIINSYRINNSSEYWEGFNYGYYENLSFTISLIPIIVTTLFIISNFMIIKPSYKKLLYSFCIVLNSIILLNVFYINRKFELRDYLSELRPLLENQYLIDGFPHSYSLYTNAIPILNPYSNNYEPSSFLTLDFDKTDKKKYILRKEMRVESEKNIYSSKFISLETKSLKFYNLKLYELK